VSVRLGDIPSFSVQAMEIFLVAPLDLSDMNVCAMRNAGGSLVIQIVRCTILYILRHMIQAVFGLGSDSSWYLEYLLRCC
jgi:hypothetical protein